MPAKLFQPSTSYRGITESLRELYLTDPRPWDGDNRPLDKLYTSASNGECPIQIDTSTPSRSHLPLSASAEEGCRKLNQAAFFNYLKPEAQEILNELFEKYATDGEMQSILPEIVKVPPISQHVSVGEIVSVFGGPDELRLAVNQLRTLLS